MRRPRNKLEVSTFPFLAVLLCAMGALILILMVFDRRAKLAANERNRLAADAKLRERSEEIKKLKATWQKEDLAAAEDEVRARGRLEGLVTQGKNLQVREEEIRKRLHQTQRKWEALDQWIRESKSRIEIKKDRKEVLVRHLEMEKREGQAALEKLTEKERELAELNSRVVALKKLLADLKSGGVKPAESYSIVPYFGKKGESKKPIYVECTGGGVVFHPGVVAFGPEEAAPIRDEVFRRARVLHEEVTSNGSIPPAPFLLLLIRPEGIESYWKLQKILRSDKVEFGYELIDGDWKLDFPDDARLVRAAPANGLPLKMGGFGNGGAESGFVGQKSGGSQAKGPGLGGIAPGSAVGHGGGLGNGPGNGGSGYGSSGIPGGSGALAGNRGLGGFAGARKPGAAGYGAGGNGFEGDPEDPDKIPGLSGMPRPGQLGFSGGPAPLTGGLPGSLGPQGMINNGPGPSGIGAGGIAGTQGGNGSSGEFAGVLSGRGPGGPGGNGGEIGPQGLGSGGRAGGAAGPGFETKVGQGGNGPLGPNGVAGAANVQGANGNGPGGTGTPGVAQPGGNQITGVPQGDSSTPGSTAGAEQNPGSNSAEGGVSGELPSLDPRLIPDKPKREVADNNEKDPKKSPKREYSVGAVSSGGSGGDDQPNPFSRVAVPLPTSDSGEPQQPRPLRIARLEGEREYTIFVECRAAGLVLQPEGLVIAGHDLETEAGAKRFVDVITRQIEKKNRKNPPGEPPLRGKLKFLVWSDGVRWYHASFPLVEGLDIPKVRQNLEPEDSIREILSGR
jgi:hypothetical protein